MTSRKSFKERRPYGETLIYSRMNTEGGLPPLLVLAIK